MSAVVRDLRSVYPDRVRDRQPNTGYVVAEWLDWRAMPLDPMEELEWFGASYADPSLTGRFRRRAG
jgi:hypothetical protein